MKLYLDSLAPNARRVEMFVLEKHLDIATENVDIGAGASRSPDFLAKNPLGQVPVLELDDGTCITESIAICRYLDASGAAPSLFGSSPRDIALIEMWSRRVEFGLFIPAVDYGHHSHEFFADRFQQIPELAVLCKERVEKTCEILVQQLAVHPYVAGPALTIADITAYCGIEVARLWGIEMPADQNQLRAWYQRMAERPSAACARYLEPAKG